MLAVLLPTTLFPGCAAQRAERAQQAELYELLHDHALRALETGRFTLEVDEFYVPETRRHPVRTVTRNYLTVKDGRAEVFFVPGPRVWAKSRADELNRLNTASLRIVKRKRNGDVKCLLTVEDNVRGHIRLGFDMHITLFAGTNECFVIVGSGAGGPPVGNLRGRVRPVHARASRSRPPSTEMSCTIRSGCRTARPAASRVVSPESTSTPSAPALCASAMSV